ncbi:MAG: MarR family transcriptional regulator [Lachnospiraceae bacterium]|nr:MarR family transcriptional regulator [Lachnospiraceae bacterium]
MSEENELRVLMEKIYCFERILGRYQNISRSYGTSTLLYLSEVHMIETIGSNEPISAAELAKMKNTTPSAISQLIKKLDSKKLLVRDNIKGNKKTIYIKLSREGRKIYKFYKKLNEKKYSGYLEKLPNLTEEDIVKMIKLMNIITEEFMEEIYVLDM